MFLRRTRQNRRALFNKFFIDVWSNITLKRKSRNRSTKKFLQFFNKYIIHGSAVGRRFTFLYGRYLPGSNRKLRRKEWWQRKKRNIKKKTLRSPQKRKEPMILISDQIYKSFLLSRLQSYFSCKQLHSFVKPVGLLKLWMILKKRRKRKKFYQRKKWNYHQRPKYIWLRRKRDYRITPLVNLVFQQYHYGFSTLASFKAYVRKINAGACTGFGLESLFSAQLFNSVGGLPNIRAAYNLIRAGGVLLNNCVCTNPRKFLNVYDGFRIIFPFNVIVLDFFLKRLNREMVILPPPPYIEFNLRVLSFKIWRTPQKLELSRLSYYPFRRKDIIWNEVKLLGWE